MKLYLLLPVENDELWSPWCDKAFGFVVRANSEEEARALAQAQGGDETSFIAGDHYARGADGTPVWTNPGHTTCEELTTAGDAEVVMRDFAAG